MDGDERGEVMVMESTRGRDAGLEMLEDGKREVEVYKAGVTGLSRTLWTLLERKWKWRLTRREGRVKGRIVPREVPASPNPSRLHFSVLPGGLFSTKSGTIYS